MWSLHKWVWRLESPLSIGMPPAGSLNRCRLYIPARTIWAAVTSETARGQAEDFPEYRDVGEMIREQVRFSYLFPAERAGGEWRAWLPRFEIGGGLVWHCQGMQGDAVLDRVFRRRLLDARPGTAIDADTDSAESGSLRETECVLPFWRRGEQFADSAVGFVGYFFLSENATLPTAPEMLFLGGDTRYGLGRLRLVERVESGDFFGAPIEADVPDPTIESAQILAHAQEREGDEVIGAREVVVGWDSTRKDGLAYHSESAWLPGSVAAKRHKWKVGSDGIWRG